MVGHGEIRDQRNYIGALVAFGEFLEPRRTTKRNMQRCCEEKIKSLIGKEKAKKAKIECRMDSELARRQLNHIYKIENEKLQPLFFQAWNLTLDFAEVVFVHVRREYNTRADAEANKAMDAHTKQKEMF
jgi:hypothetical protein